MSQHEIISRIVILAATFKVTIASDSLKAGVHVAAGQSTTNGVKFTINEEKNGKIKMFLGDENTYDINGHDEIKNNDTGQPESDNTNLKTSDQTNTGGIKKHPATQLKSGKSRAEWTGWGAFSLCSETCGDNSVRWRVRYCIKGDSIVQNKKCKGSQRDMDRCANLPACPSTGGEWTEWQMESECPKCGSAQAFQKRKRFCITEEPCSGNHIEKTPCDISPCKPTWEEWSSWSSCTATCGGGTTSRNRQCMDGDTAVSPNNCRGEHILTKKCNDNMCLSTNSLQQICGVMPEASNRAKLRISGGVETPHGDMPWQASWQFKECHNVYGSSRGRYRDRISCKWRHVCGATLVHPSWVVTAAHCIEEIGFFVNYKNPDETKWRVYVGREIDDTPGSFAIHSPQRIEVYGGYNYKYIPIADITMIKLKQPVSFNKYIVPACLPEGHSPQDQEDCYVSGWGYTSAKAKRTPIIVERTNQLLHGVVSVVGYDKCIHTDRWYKLLRRTDHICAMGSKTPKGNQDTCEGDSGGPMVCRKPDDPSRFYLAAVTSFSFAGCGEKGHNGIYARVTSYERWMKRLLSEDDDTTLSDDGGQDNFDLDLTVDSLYDMEHSG